MELFSVLYKVSFNIIAIVHVITLNPLNAELNPIYHLLALLGAHHILHVSRIYHPAAALCDTQC